jgi:CheY-like chemotaxis protein
MDFEKIPFSLEDAVETVYHAMLFKAEEKKLTFKINIESNVPAVIEGDPTRLNQILINLAGNAIKFTETGEVILDIREIDKQGNMSMLQFSIIDTGIGISEESLNKIFDSFSQASSDTTRKFGGTGLGLTISKQLIELQGGNIQVKSEIGKGTSFIFTIPYTIGDKATGKERNSHDDVNGTELKGIRVLLVEDNAFNQMVAIDTLNDLIPDLFIEVAENGLIALEMISAASYDVVLMDIQMPEMDGFEATRKIREMTDVKKATPIMAMTANVTPEEVTKCFEAGMDAYISKPFETQDLLNKLAKLTIFKSKN